MPRGSLLTRLKYTPQSLLTWLVLMVLLGFGLFLRVYDLGDPPLEFHPTRQLHSAIVARGMYHQMHPLTDPDRQAFVLSQWKTEGIIEPPIGEQLAAWAYAAFGSEQLWFPRLLSSLYWLSAALGLFLLLHQRNGWLGACVAMAFFLFAPYALPASRSFQPDVLMVALLVWFVWAQLRWMDSQKPADQVIAAALGGLAIFVKPSIIFLVVSVFFITQFNHVKPRVLLRRPYFWISLALIGLPTTLFFLYGSFIAGFSQGQFSMRFFPAMWIDPAFYLRWARKIQVSVGISAAALGVLGVFSLPNRSLRTVWTAYLLGYLLYGFVFAYHVSTHDYYHLPLFPLVAVGIGALAQYAARQLAQQPGWAKSLIALTLLLWFAFTVYDLRATLRKDDFREQAARMAALGEELRRQSVVGLFPDYAYGLRYYGWINPVIFPDSGDLFYQSLAGQQTGFDQIFTEKTRGMDLFVVTDLVALARQPALLEKLSTYPLVRSEPDLLIYSLSD